MPVFKTIQQYVDLETGEIIFPFNDREYYIVKKVRKRTQPDKTKAFIVIKIINLCRKNNQIKMSI